MICSLQKVMDPGLQVDREGHNPCFPWVLKTQGTDLLRTVI